MFDKKIAITIQKEIKPLPMDENTLIILRADSNLREEQYKFLKDQCTIHNKNGKAFKILLLEKGISLEAILTGKI